MADKNLPPPKYLKLDDFLEKEHPKIEWKGVTYTGRISEEISSVEAEAITKAGAQLRAVGDVTPEQANAMMHELETLLVQVLKITFPDIPEDVVASWNIKMKSNIMIFWSKAEYPNEQAQTTDPKPKNPRKRR